MDQKFDIKLKTMANQPYLFNGLSIQPKALDVIIKDGYEQYNQKLNLIAATKETLFENNELLQDEVVKTLSLIELFIISDNREFLDIYLDALKYFTNSNEVKYVKDTIVFDGTILDMDMVNDLIEIIKLQNCIEIELQESFNPLNERAKRIKEKMLENKKKIQELKKSTDENEGLNILDLISILCSNANGINLSNVFDLNMFQFNNQFNRMVLIDQYELNVQSLISGSADPKKIKLKHWISKVE